MKTNTQIVYRGYARKSSEAEDRQALSIVSQIGEDIKIAALNNITLEEKNVLTETHSAKDAFSRPVFEQLIKSIERGEVQGIIAWHANRLSRNSIDSARLVDLFDKGRLLEIVTQQQVFRNTPQDKFMLTLFCSQAKMENDNKGLDVQRGLRKKCEMGFPPGVAKIGYLNDYGRKGERRILIDPERFDLVCQLFKTYLTGNYSVRALLKYSNEVLGLRNVQRLREGGKPIQLSRIYEMLKDPFYAGFFFALDENREMARYTVNEEVPRVISEEQYWKIQTMLGRKGRPCPSVNKACFPYRGRTQCESCGGSITAEHKYQLICSVCKCKFSYQNKKECPHCKTPIEKMTSPKYLHYIYYHCTKRRNPNCTEGGIREELIDGYMADYVENKLLISEALRDWCLRHFEEIVEMGKRDALEIRRSWEKEKVKKEKEYDELLAMKMRKQIDEDDFTRLKTINKEEIRQIDENLSLNRNNTGSFDEVKETFDLLTGIADIFKNGTYDQKVNALSVLGSNLTLKDKIPNLSNKKMIEALENGLFAARAINEAFEPAKTQADKDKTEVFASVCPTLLRAWDDVRQAIIEEGE